MTAKIYHADLYGTRASKYTALSSSSMESVAWQELAPNAPFYLFMPQEQAFREEYEAGWSVTEIFPVNVLGFQTHRDHFAIDFDADVLKKRISTLRETTLSDDEVSERFLVKDNRDWQIAKARAKLRASEDWEANFTDCLYRPFDTRPCYFADVAMDYPRRELLDHVFHKTNLTMLLPRQLGLEGFSHILCTRNVAESCVISSKTKEQNYVFPLWLYPTKQEQAFGMERRANIAPAFMAELAGRVGETPTPEDVFHYAYAVFHAPTYRTRYAAFLKTDFPRLPLPPDAETFHALAALGAKLTALHLLEAPELKQHGIGFPVGGTHLVQKMRREDRYVPGHTPAPDSGGGIPHPARQAVPPSPSERRGFGEEGPAFAPPALGAGGRSLGRVRLNETEYFENVPSEAWHYQVGGYQPAFKWLDDRKGRTLSEDDITHYRRMLAAMRDTANLLPTVDAVFARLIHREPARDGLSSASQGLSSE